MAPIIREQALENALASSRIEGKIPWQTMQWILCRMGAIRVRLY